jgi:hypothetical protein
VVRVVPVALGVVRVDRTVVRVALVVPAVRIVVLQVPRALPVRRVPPEPELVLRVVRTMFPAVPGAAISHAAPFPVPAFPVAQ